MLEVKNYVWLDILTVSTEHMLWEALRLTTTINRGNIEDWVTSVR